MLPYPTHFLSDNIYSHPSPPPGSTWCEASGGHDHSLKWSTQPKLCYPCCSPTTDPSKERVNSTSQETQDGPSGGNHLSCICEWMCMCEREGNVICMWHGCATPTRRWNRNGNEAWLALKGGRITFVLRRQWVNSSVLPSSAGFP